MKWVSVCDTGGTGLAHKSVQQKEAMTKSSAGKKRSYLQICVYYRSKGMLEIPRYKSKVAALKKRIEGISPHDQTVWEQALHP